MLARAEPQSVQEQLFEPASAKFTPSEHDA